MHNLFTHFQDYYYYYYYYYVNKKLRQTRNIGYTNEYKREKELRKYVKYTGGT